MHFLILGAVFFFAILGFIVLFAAVSTYNGLVGLKNQVDRAWANIDVVLKERFDLIPRLISVCEQYVKYERGTLDHVMQARSAYGSAVNVDDKIKAATAVGQTVRGLLALGEAYPNLKSSDQFVEMEKTLRDLEKQIADRREMYNESVTNFNTRCQIFPDVFFAQMLGYKTVALYKVEAFERETPPMKLDLPA
jgi:LemA protein